MIFPSLTSVGATTGFSPEAAADFSSGGFSNIFGIPSFQESAVASYLSYLGTTDSGLYNASGRGFPDVSAQGVDFIIGYEGDFYTVDGTSCASPTFASVVALLNDRLIAAGKSTLGWLNPFLYSTGASALNDITSGDNPGCNTNGFTATTGWDPVRFFVIILAVLFELTSFGLRLGHWSRYSELQRSFVCDRCLTRDSINHYLLVCEGTMAGVLSDLTFVYTDFLW